MLTQTLLTTFKLSLLCLFFTPSLMAKDNQFVFQFGPKLLIGNTSIQLEEGNQSIEESYYHWGAGLDIFMLNLSEYTFTKLDASGAIDLDGFLTTIHSDLGLLLPTTSALKLSLGVGIDIDRETNTVKFEEVDRSNYTSQIANPKAKLGILYLFPEYKTVKWVKVDFFLSRSFLKFIGRNENEYISLAEKKTLIGGAFALYIRNIFAEASYSEFFDVEADREHYNQFDLTVRGYWGVDNGKGAGVFLGLSANQRDLQLELHNPQPKGLTETRVFLNFGFGLSE